MTAQVTRPKISVLTPCLNGARHVGEAIDSVLLQRYCSAEHIVADGASTDGTLEILRGHSHLRTLSAPDRGLYDALNNALATARGEFIGILNCDDSYADNVFVSVVAAFEDPGVMAVAGDAVTFRDAAGARTVVEGYTAVEKDLLTLCTLGNPFMNAWFFRACVFEQIGRFDASYRVAGDREFMLRFALSGLRYVTTGKLAYRYRLHPGSMTFSGEAAIGETVLREHHRMTGHYLRKPDLSKKARGTIRRARSRDAICGALYWARHYDVRKLLSHALAGTRHDFAWPARFAGQVVRGWAVRLGWRQQGGRI
jgi:glycosyltransferase involved in cell wall biosynthesis